MPIETRKIPGKQNTFLLKLNDILTENKNSSFSTNCLSKRSII